MLVRIIARLNIHLNAHQIKTGAIAYCPAAQWEEEGSRAPDGSTGTKKPPLATSSSAGGCHRNVLSLFARCGQRLWLSAMQLKAVIIPVQWYNSMYGPHMPVDR